MEVRIDKWMWATRIFKTRTIAADACKKGRVMVGGVTVKPSRTIKVGEVIQVRKPPITFSFKVLALAQNRMGAKLVPEYMENVTTPDQPVRIVGDEPHQRIRQPCQRHRSPHQEG